MGKARTWIGPVSGVLSVVAFVVGGVIFAGVDAEPSDLASSVLAAYAENADNIFASAFLVMLSVGFLVVFLGHLRSQLRNDGAGWAADTLLAGGIVLAGALIVLSGVELAGAEAGNRGHTEVAQGAIDFVWNGALLFSPGLLAVGIATAVASFAYAKLPKWLGAFGVLVALGALAPWIGIFVFFAWVLAASIVELIRVSRPAAATDAK